MGHEGARADPDRRGSPRWPTCTPTAASRENLRESGGDTVPSRVIEYTGDGTLLRSWTVAGQDLSQGRGVQVPISDAHGRLILAPRSWTTHGTGSPTR